MKNIHVENIRRVCDRGIAYAMEDEHGSPYVDVFQHILDELERIPDEKLKAIEELL
jgi:hypothetical protein